MNLARMPGWLRWWFKFVAARRHSFSLTSSFDQRLSLVIFAAVCLSSFLAWPPIQQPYFQLVKWGIALGVLLVFMVQWRRLKAWSLAFWIDELGRCAFIAREAIEVECEPDNGATNAFKTLWVSPWLVVFHLYANQNSCGQNSGGQKKHLILVWRDMLDDTSYRHLCRLLLRFGKAR